MILKKKFCKRLSEEKNCMQHKWNKKKDSCTGVRKKRKMIQSYFITQIALQNPSEPATILPLFPFKLWIWWCCRIIALYKQCITIDVSRNQCRFRVACGFGKWGFLFFFFPLSFFSVRKWWPERESVPRKWSVFTAKSTRNTVTLF